VSILSGCSAHLILNTILLFEVLEVPYFIRWMLTSALSEMIMPLFSKNPRLFNCAWPGPCRADEGYAMLYPASCGYVASAAAWFVVGATGEAALPRAHSYYSSLAHHPTHHPSFHMASLSSSNFQSIFDAALQSYNNKTKNKLLDHPLATQLQSCDSPNAVLSVLQDLIQKFDQRRNSDERLNNWLNPTVNVLYTFSDTLGGGVGLVSSQLPISLQSVL
jgi:hypothetical protein